MGLFKKDLTVDDQGIVIASSSISLTVPYSEIEHMEMVDASTFSIGHPVSGEKTDDRYIGKFVNSAFGNYTVYAYAKVPKFIVVTYSGGKILVFNMKDLSSTERTAEKIGAVSE